MYDCRPSNIPIWYDVAWDDPSDDPCRKSVHGRGAAQPAGLGGKHATLDDIVEAELESETAATAATPVGTLVDFADDSPKTSSQPSSPSKSIGHSVLPRPYSPFQQQQQSMVEVAVVATRTSRRYAQDEAEVVPLRSVQTSSEKWTNV